MPKQADFPPGTLVMMVLRVLHSGELHGYAIAQRIRTLSSDVLRVEEGSLYPALQKMLLKGWVTAAWGTSDTRRRVRVYRLTALGRKQLKDEVSKHELLNAAIQAVLGNA
jgi:transcriptional regulator